MLVQSKCEQPYPFLEVENIINSSKSKEKQKQKTERIYFIKQKFSGFIMLFIGIITPVLLEGEATFSLIAVPMGLGLIITKRKVMMYRGYEIAEENADNLEETKIKEGKL